MIQILKKPTPCTFSKNEIEFQLTSTMQYATPRIFPFFQINVLAKPVPGVTFSVNWQNPVTSELITSNFVAASDYTAIENGIPADSFSGTLLQYTTELCKRIKLSEPLNGFYEIYQEGNTIYFKANQAISELVFVDYATNETSEYFEFINSRAFADPNEREGYQLIAGVFFESEYKSGVFRSVATLDCITGQDSIAILDISDIIDSEIESTFDYFPIPGDNQQDANFLRRWYIIFHEYWKSEPIGYTTKTDVFFTHWGGISKLDQKIANPISLLQSTKQFLTWWPSGKELYKKQNDWVAWMNIGAPANFNCVLKIYKQDGTTQTVNGPTFLLDRWETRITPVGYTQLDLEGIISSSSVKKWSFQIKSSDTVINDEFFYYPLTDSPCITDEVLLYNSFGMAETFGIVNWQETMQHNAKLVNQSQLFNNHRLKPEIFMFDSSHNTTITATTFRLEKEEGWRLQSVLNSMMAFVYRLGRYVPAAIMVEKQTVLIESEQTMSLDIQLMLAVTNDRASFFEAVPALSFIEICGISSIQIDSNGINIDDYAGLEVKINGGLFTTGNWDGTKYNLVIPITESNIYDLSVTVFDQQGKPYDVVLTIDYSTPTCSFVYSQDGNLSFQLKASAATTIDVDFGNGIGYISRFVGTGYTNVNETVDETGNKVLYMRKPCFDLITGFKSLSLDLGNFEYQKLTKLKDINIQNWIKTGKAYFNGLEEMRTILLEDCQLNAIEIGYMPNLQSLRLVNCMNLTNDAVDALISELWTDRKLFIGGLFVPEIAISGTGLSFSTSALEKINGTGAYSGEGLVSDYSFSISIS